MTVANDSVADIDDKIWYNWQQQAVPLLLDLTFEACGAPFRERFGVPIFSSILWYRTEGSHTEASWLLRNDEGVALGRLLTDVLAVPSAADSVDREFERSSRYLLELCASSRAIELPDLTEARNLLSSIVDTFLQFYAVGAITEPVQFFCAAVVSDWLDGAGDDATTELKLDRSAIASALASTSEELYATGIQRELLGHALHATDEDSLAAAVEDHAARFSWRTNNYGRARELTEVEVRDEILRLREGDPESELSELEETLRGVASQRAHVLQYVPERIRTVSLLAERFGTVMADRRKLVMNQALGEIQRLGLLVADALGLSHENALMCSPAELVGVDADRSDLERRAIERRAGYVQVLSPWPLDDAEMASLISATGDQSNWALPISWGTTVHEGAAALDALDDLDRRMGLFVTERDPDVVFGEVVEVLGLSREMLFGRACIILDPVRDADKFLEGDILIATSTTPDFLPLMSRASAIVTNMGGMFQHAAHFAREHRLPCVIGCGYATAAFRDGEPLEIDLIEGRVRRRDSE